MILLACLPLQEIKKGKKFPSPEKGKIQICNSKIGGFVFFSKHPSFANMVEIGYLLYGIFL